MIKKYKILITIFNLTLLLSSCQDDNPLELSKLDAENWNHSTHTFIEKTCSIESDDYLGIQKPELFIDGILIKSLEEHLNYIFQHRVLVIDSIKNDKALSDFKNIKNLTIIETYFKNNNPFFIVFFNKKNVFKYMLTKDGKLTKSKLDYKSMPDFYAEDLENMRPVCNNALEDGIIGNMEIKTLINTDGDSILKYETKYLYMAY